jgi:hypothetical protein
MKWNGWNMWRTTKARMTGWRKGGGKTIYGDHYQFQNQNRVPRLKDKRTDVSVL